MKKKEEDKNWFCKITFNKKKLQEIDKKVDKGTRNISIILIIIVILLIGTIIINTLFYENTSTKTPTEKEINRTCAEHGLEGAGFSINYKEGYTKILCSKNYSQTQKTKGIEDIFRWIKNV